MNVVGSPVSGGVPGVGHGMEDDIVGDEEDGPAGDPADAAQPLLTKLHVYDVVIIYDISLNARSRMTSKAYRCTCY